MMITSGPPLPCTPFFVLLLLLATTTRPGFADDGVEEIELNVERISAIGNTDVLLSTISRLALALNKCGVDVRGLKELQKVMLQSELAKCMDGSQAGYYIRRKSGSKRWLIFLDGGYYCFDKKTCRSRLENTPNMTSSLHWPATKDGTGILSWNPEVNPFLFSANVVYIPYCSSDAWSGANQRHGFYFTGAAIIDEVVRDLVSKYGLNEGTKLFLAGSSAGATGVLLNIDRVSDYLAIEAPSVSVYGIVDSGWFLDTEQLHKSVCTNTLNCPPAEAVKKGFRMWKPEIPKRCKKAYPDEPWRCFFGYRVYPYISSPLFVITYMYDRAQLLASMGGGLSTYHQVQQDNYNQRNSEGILYMRELARLMNYTLTNVSAVFAPSCMDHEILLRNMWHSISIRGTTLLEALRCWEGSQETTNRPGQLTFPSWPSSADIDANDFLSVEDDDNNNNNNDNDDALLSNDVIRHSGNRRLSREERRRLRRLRRRRRKQRQRMLQQRRRRIIRRDVTGAASDEQLSNALQSNSLSAFIEEKQAQCQSKLYDYCTAPNCNLHCPTYLNLYSGSGSSSSGFNNIRDASDDTNDNSDDDYDSDFSDVEASINDPAKLEEIIRRQR